MNSSKEDGEEKAGGVGKGGGGGGMDDSGLGVRRRDLLVAVRKYDGLIYA